MTEEVKPDARLERRSKRKFSASEKQRLLAEMDQLPRGEIGAWLRRNGLYASQVSNWRKLTEAGVDALEPKATGRKPKDSKDREIETLKREKAHFEKRALVAEGLVDLQKKVLALVALKEQTA
jgi:transposase